MTELSGDELRREYITLCRSERRFVAKIDSMGNNVFPSEDAMREAVYRDRAQRADAQFEGWILCADGRTTMEYAGIS